MPDTPGRRTLRFASIDEILPEVERLQDGHTTVGSWSLAEICNHIAAAMRLAVDMPASTQHDPSLRFSDEAIERVFADGQIPEGLPRPPPVSSLEPLGETEAVDLLREAIAYYKDSGGPRAPHRYFGPLSKERWDRLQCIHCAHHLSFAIPTTN